MNRIYQISFGGGVFKSHKHYSTGFNRADALDHLVNHFEYRGMTGFFLCDQDLECYDAGYYVVAGTNYRNLLTCGNLKFVEIISADERIYAKEG